MRRHLWFSLLLFVSARAVELPGTWSNGLDEFKTISLMLRSDGQAIFATAVLPGYALWEKTDTGLRLTLAGNGQSLVIPFNYDPATELLTGKLQDSEVVLKKISDQEPPDMLAQAKERHAKEMEQMKKRWRMDSRTFADRQAVRAFLEQWLAQESTEYRAESIDLAASDGQGQLSVRGFNTLRTISVVVESRRIAKPSGYPLESKLLAGDSVSDLPVGYELAVSKREALVRLAQAPGVKSETHAFSQVSPFQTESFFRSVQFLVNPDSQPDTITLAEQVMDILWEKPPVEIKATLHFRIPPAP